VGFSGNLLKKEKGKLKEGGEVNDFAIRRYGQATLGGEWLTEDENHKG